MTLARVTIKIFADCADLAQMIALNQLPYIDGFTTNPTLMRHAGVTDYAAFGQAVVAAIPNKSVSFEVLADDLNAMERQARIIASWGPHVYVKLPVTLCNRQQSTGELTRRLLRDGLRVNVTGITDAQQVAWYRDCVDSGDAIVSVFAGRIADTGRDPARHVERARQLLKANVQVLWASAREVRNISQAEHAGANIITLTPPLLQKLAGWGKDLRDVSEETVQMFYRDAVASGLTL